MLVRYTYDAWGNCTIHSSTTNNVLANVNPIRYRSYYYDKDTGLYFLNARYYNPQWRRFISPDDSAYLDPETPNGLNLYTYCYNDPVNYCDPSGHVIEFWLAAGLFLGAAGLVAGGIYAGASSYNSGNRGWDLVGDIASGALSLGIAGFAVGAWIGAFGGALFAGNLFAQASSVFAGATYAWEMLLAGGMTPTLYMLGSNLSNSFHYTTHVFWSGGKSIEELSSVFATSLNGTTLQMTKLGQYLNSIDASRQLWEIASKNFANQVPHGSIIYTIQSINGLDPYCIWLNAEYPILKEKLEIIIYIILGGR